MVYLKKLEIRGFKSLGNRPVTLEFDKALTVITGPNGGGKSNIIDAMTFCLGQNSPKMLRVNRLASLVYDGGPQGQKPLSTRVTITCDNHSGSIPVDSEDVILTRELKVDGEGSYFMNGKRVPKNAVSEVLSLAMVSPEGFNIVPQGMVTRISELSPDEKREIIGEIAGVAQFDHKKTESLKQLQEADTRLQVALARMSEIKKRVESLEGERNDQLRLKRLEDEIRWLRAVVASRNLADIRRRIREREKLVKDAAQGLEEFENKLKEHRDQSSLLEHEREKFISTMIDSAGGRLLELQSSIMGIRHESKTLCSDMDHAEVLIKSIKESLPNLRQQKEGLNTQIRELEEHVLQLSSKLSDLEQEKAEAEKDLDAVQTQKKRLEGRLSKATSSVDRFRKRVAIYQNTMRMVDTEIESLKNNQTVALDKLKSLRDKSDSFLETLKQLEDRVKELGRLKILEEESVENVGESLAILSGRRLRIGDEIAKAISVLDKAGTAVLKYESGRSVAEQVIADEIGLVKLDELGIAGAIQGYIGRFDQLIRYPSQYEQAVLAVGNRWIRSIVVENMTAMLKVAEMAKKLKVGRLAIIPISEVADSPRTNRPEGEGIIGALAGMVTIDEGREGLVNFVFGDTILVRSARIGYDVSSLGFRSVTPQGDVFEPKGAAFETGYVAKLDAIVRMIQDDASFTAIKDALGSLRTIISKRKTDIDRLDKQTKNFEKERVRRTLLLERLTTEIDSVSKFIAKYHMLRGSIEKKLEKVSALPERIKSRIEKLAAYQSSIDARIELLNKKIEQVNIQGLTEEMRTLDEKKAYHLDRVEKISGNIRVTYTQLAKDQSNLEYDLRPGNNRLLQQIQQLEAELSQKGHFVEEGKVRFEKLSQQLEAMENEEATLLDSSKKSRPLLESYEERLKYLRDEEEKLRRGMARIEKQLFEANRSLERMTESEQRYLGELTLYGYDSPIEYFDEDEILLHHLNLEYDELRNRVNLLADSQYKEVYLGYRNLSLRRNQLEAERNTVVSFIESIDQEKTRVFINTFEKIDRELRLVFSKLTGGSAWLEIENPEDIFSSGLFLMTQFLNKIPRESCSVSGGEKTISAVSFILAIQSVYPSPFYLFDEIDAHLDAVNSERLAELLRERASNAQIIMVSLKDTIVSRAYLVYGVYMTKSVSRVIKYRPKMQVVVEHG